MARIIHGEKILEQVGFKKEKELERVVVENSERIFGRDTIYFDLKKLISSGKSKKRKNLAAIPDGYLLTLSDPPSLALVEVELLKHDPFDHIAAQLARFNVAVKSKSKYDLVEKLYDYLKKNDGERDKFRQYLGTEIEAKLLAAIKREISYVMVINGMNETVDKIVGEYPIKVHVIQKFKGENEYTYHIDGVDDPIEGFDGEEEPGTIEVNYLRGKNTKKIWKYLKNRIASDIPGSKFHMTQCYGSFVVLNGSKKIPICGVTSAKNELKLFYSTKPEKGVIRADGFVKELGGKGHFYGGSDMASVLKTGADIDRAIPYIKKILKHKLPNVATRGTVAEASAGTEDLRRYIREQVSLKIPSGEFHNTKYYEAFAIPDGTSKIPIFHTTAGKKRIPLYYSTNLGAGIIHKSSSVENLGSGRRYGKSELRSFVQTRDEADMAIRLILELYEQKSERAEKPSFRPKTEQEYLRKYPKIKGLWMEAKNRIEGKFPDAKFEMTAVVGKYKSLNGRTLCWLQATGKKINLAYGIKVRDKILSESPFVKDVSDVGKNFSGEYRSSIKNTDDIEKVLPLLDNIWGFHAGKYGKGYTQIYDA